jgi:hypothetical protein
MRRVTRTGRNSDRRRESAGGGLRAKREEEGESPVDRTFLMLLRARGSDGLFVARKGTRPFEGANCSGPAAA